MQPELNPSHFSAGAAAPVDTDFQSRIDPYRQELLLHCYRFFGSMDDAEDAVQDTLIRAWRRLDTLKEQRSLRAWLYKIATRVSLDRLDETWPRGLTRSPEPSDPLADLPAPLLDPVWLEPIPGELIDHQTASPEARYETRESVSLAFMVLLQALPGQQRAVLLLRDVLGWRAQDVAETLELSLAAVNSALQRARATIKKKQGEAAFKPWAHNPARENAGALKAYVQAWETADLARLASLLRGDATLTMPPLPAWFAGRSAILAFYQAHHLLAASSRLLAVGANGQPAFAVYQRGPDGAFRPAALQVVALAGGQITQITSFLALDGRLFSRFSLPATL